MIFPFSVPEKFPEILTAATSIQIIDYLALSIAILLNHAT
jgi:hypothetical protein